MDLNLQNAYVEVLLDNFISVVKQNLMFQAQLEVTSKTLNTFNELKERTDFLEQENKQLKGVIESVTSENVILKNDISVEGSGKTLKEERVRLQSAVNDYMRQVKTLREEILKVKSESQDVLVKNVQNIEDLNKYIQRLESVIPASKLKKLKTVDVTDFEEKVASEKTEIVDTKFGGSF